MKKILLLMMFVSTTAFADDIWFSSPRHGDSVKGMLTIQLEPRHDDVDVRVWIEYDDENDRVVWRGRVGKKDNYTVKVDTSKFKRGKYEVNAEYYVGREDYDGDVDFWID